MHVVVLFYNIGGYHAARLGAAHTACQDLGWHLTAIHVTDQTREHPWGTLDPQVPFPLQTLLPAATTPATVDRGPNSTIAGTLLSACLSRLKPDVMVIPGWGFPISRVALRWSKQQQIPAILMSESKWDDEKRNWLKELLKAWLYIRKFDAALVGGRLHRDYLIKLGFPGDRIFLGYDAVDNDYFTHSAAIARNDPQAARMRQPEIPEKPYFLAATRFIKRKNVPRLVKAYANYRFQVGPSSAWDLVICGKGAEEAVIRQTIADHHLGECVHLPGFKTYQTIGDWYGLASAFVHPALQEQWGLVVNEACAAGLPILGSHTVG
ncbi:MAG: glycosyltransferase family 4 protein, partial [Kovacikia sp.]